MSEAKGITEQRPALFPVVADYVFVLAVLVGGMLIAVQMRLRVFFGSTLGEAYVAQPLALYPMLAAGSLVGVIVLWLVVDPPLASTSRRRFFAVLTATLTAFMLIAVLLPDVSLLQMLYFVIASAVIGLVTTVFTSRRAGGREDVYLTDYLRKLWARRVLTAMWVQYNLRSRYSQTALGIVWIVMLPLMTALVFTFIFSEVLRVNVGDVPYISYFLAAIVPWTLTSQGIHTATGSILNHMALINQIYFPREILVLTRLGETLVDLAFAFLVLIVMNLLGGLRPNGYYLLLPVVLAIHLCLVLGIMFFVSYLSVMVRDIPQLVGVGLQILFYVTPILYSLDRVPAQYLPFIVLNPFTPIIQAYRDILVYARPPDLVNLYYPAVLALVALYTGYMFFKQNEHRLADFV